MNRIKISGRARVMVMNQNGSVAKDHGWTKNLLLSRGMNSIAEMPFADLFLFASIGTGTTSNKITPSTSGTANLYTLTGSTLTRNASPTTPRDFVADDVGRLVLNEDGEQCIIDAYVSATEVSVVAVGSGSLTNYTNKTAVIYLVEQEYLENEIARTGTYSSVSGENGYSDASNVRTLKRTFVFSPEAENKETVTGSYSWASTTVTRTSGARDFVAADVGKYIAFSATEYAVIESITSVTDVEVDRTGTATGSIEIYGGATYGEIGFSELETLDEKLNIRVRIEDGSGNSDPVFVLGENPETGGQQLKVTYELSVSVGPSTTQTTPAAPINDPLAIMSASKAGKHVIEALSLSDIENDGDTGTSFAILEPSIAGALALSTIKTALSPLDGPDRSSGAAYVEMENDAYVPDSHQIISVGEFESNDAIGDNWWSMGIYDIESARFAFTFLFNAKQRKTGENSLTVRFLKSWEREF